MANEDKATRYHRCRRRASLAGACASALFLSLLLATGGSVRLRDAVTARIGPSLVPAVAAYVAVPALLHALMWLPLAWYRDVILGRRYGLPARARRGWLADRIRAGLLTAAILMAGAVWVTALIRWDAERWWLAASAASALLLAGAALLAPALIRRAGFATLDRPVLAGRLSALAARAGMPLAGIHVWRTDRARALLVGLGRSQRILLSEKLLAEYADEEIEVVVAHELGHYAHRDSWWALALEIAIVILAFVAADRALAAGAASFALTGKADLAALPLVLIGGGAAWLILSPAAHACSRRHERRADGYALALTGNAGAFIRTIQRMTAQHLAEERPTRLVELLSSHPSPSARIEAARAWADAAGGVQLQAELSGGSGDL